MGQASYFQQAEDRIDRLEFQLELMRREEKSLAAKSERLQGIVDKVECLRAVVVEITSEMANIDSLTGLGMRENVWREKLREAADAAKGE